MKVQLYALMCYWYDNCKEKSIKDNTLTNLLEQSCDSGSLIVYYQFVSMF